jgi:competence protein ComEA
MRQAGYVVAGLLAGFVLAGAVFFVARPPAGKPVTLEAPPTQAPLQVHVIGAVLRPGVYIFAEGSRVQDAVTAAGGATSDADLNALNLAALLEDGQQLNVPSSVGAGAAPSPTAGFRVLPPPASPPTPGAQLININTASAGELASLPGIGPTTAQRIVDYRTQNGPFARIEDLLNVAGIGPATFDNIRALITV